ncbi:MAG: hypothetical protein H6738_04530 [Alphaproteobacteria bacterium]|nr:hypothetical protein [Alphaproteobacteria bacterium]MCB9696039.1 hypothetical protein [Alphaproteobacteria bacterium]
MWWWALAACDGGTAETPCQDGFERAADGNCYPIGDDDDDDDDYTIGWLHTGRRWTDHTGDSTGCPTFYDGPALVQLASVTCQTQTLRVRGESQGWISDARVHLRDNANAIYWSENHRLTSYEFDVCGLWDHFDVELAAGASISTWQEDVSTVFTCAIIDDNVMSYAIGIWDFDGVYADCLAWGVDPEEIVNNPSADAGEPADFDVVDCVIGVTTR